MYYSVITSAWLLHRQPSSPIYINENTNDTRYELSIIEPDGEAVTRSFRIDKAWDKALTELAERIGISTSGLLEKIVRDYLLFYRWVEELESVIFSPNTIKEVIDTLSDEQLKAIAEKVAKITFEESYLTRGDELTLETVKFQITQQMGKYAHWFSVDEHDTNSHYFYIKHRLGEKWSIFVEAYLSSLIQKIGNVHVITERDGENILIRLEYR